MPGQATQLLAPAVDGAVEICLKPATHLHVASPEAPHGEVWICEKAASHTPQEPPQFDLTEVAHSEAVGSVE